MLLLLLPRSRFRFSSKAFRVINCIMTSLDCHLREIQKESLEYNISNESSFLGEGQFGRVFKGKYLGFDVAIKFIDGVSTKEMINEFKTEALTMQSLNFPGIINFYGAQINENPRYIVIEQAICSLSDLLHTNKHTELVGELSLNAKLSFMNEVCNSLIYLHTRTPPIIHRDIKSANVLISTDFHTKLTDFGLSKIKEMASTRGTNSAKGTPAYMSPEILDSEDGEYPYGPASDMYAFAVLMNETLGEEMPFAKMNMAQIIRKLMKPEGENRPNLFTSTDKGKLIEESIKTEMVTLITKGWSTPVADRPSFESAKETLSHLASGNSVLSGAFSPFSPLRRQESGRTTTEATPCQTPIATPIHAISPPAQHHEGDVMITPPRPSEAIKYQSRADLEEQFEYKSVTAKPTQGHESRSPMLQRLFNEQSKPMLQKPVPQPIRQSQQQRQNAIDEESKRAKDRAYARLLEEDKRAEEETERKRVELSLTAKKRREEALQKEASQRELDRIEGEERRSEILVRKMSLLSIPSDATAPVILHGHTSQVTVLLTADIRLFTASTDCTVKVWDLEIREGDSLLATLKTQHPVQHLAITDSHDKLIASDGLNMHFEIFDLMKYVLCWSGVIGLVGNPVRSISVHQNLVYTSVVGVALAGVVGVSGIKVWDMDSKVITHIYDVEPSGNIVASILIHADMLYAYGVEHTLHVWNIVTHELLHAISPPVQLHSESKMSICCIKNVDRLCIPSQLGSVSMLDIHTLHVVSEVQLTDCNVHHIASIIVSGVAAHALIFVALHSGDVSVYNLQGVEVSHIQGEGSNRNKVTTLAVNDKMKKYCCGRANDGFFAVEVHDYNCNKSL